MRVDSMLVASSSVLLGSSPQQLRLAVESRAYSNKWRTFIRRRLVVARGAVAQFPRRSINSRERPKDRFTTRTGGASLLPRRSRVFSHVAKMNVRFTRRAFSIPSYLAYTRKIDLTLLSHELFTIEKQSAALNFVPEILEISKRSIAMRFVRL